MGIGLQAATAVCLLGLLSACSSTPGSSDSAKSQDTVAPPASSHPPEIASSQPTAQDGRRPSISGAGSYDVPVFRGKNYRLLIRCQGMPLKIVNIGGEPLGRPVARATCDNVPFETQVFSPSGTQHIRILAAADTHWSVLVATGRAAKRPLSAANL